MFVKEGFQAKSQNRGQYGMGNRHLEGVDYDRLLMSLQSPLPNDQDMAISVCTLLSNETKHVLKFSRAPRILDLLLAHAGIFNHCKLREVMETSYWDARKLRHNTFWMENVPEGVARHPLCECFIQKVNHSIGIEDEYADYFGDEVDEADMNDEEQWILTQRKRIADKESDCFNPSVCCIRCPCRRIKSHDPLDPFPALNDEPQPLYLLRTSAYSDDRIGQRITQISNILRNLSFEEENAVIMANNPSLLRFVLVSSECSWGQIPQLALDLLGNVAHHLQLKEPAMDPLSCRVLSLIVGGLFSSDRFRVLRSLECLRDLCKKEGNDEVLNQYVKLNVYKRICELLTISDIMLLIYTLECLLSMTGLGEAVCNELSRVQGSMASLVSLVTVEAQSYGPKGCILMRVVETVTGSLQPSQGGTVTVTSTSQPATGQVTTVNGSSAQVLRPVHSPQSSPHPSAASPGSMTRVAVGYSPATAIGSAPGQLALTASGNPSALQAQLQQYPPLNSLSTTSPARVPSPALSPSLSLSPVPSPAQPVHLGLGSPSGQYLSTGGGAMNQTRIVTIGPSSTGSISGGVFHQDSKGNVVAGATETPSSPVVTVFNHVTPTAHVSNPTNSTDTVIPSISLPLVTPKGTLSEEGWALAWLKGAFEVFLGTSIEQGESYRMYSFARKNPQKTLTMEQFVQCVKCAYGSTVGPVIKQFGSSSLSFFEGIRPKMSVKSAVNVVNSPVISAGTSNLTAATTQGSAPVVVVCPSTLNSPQATNAPATPTAHIPSKENKTLSPILKATLSRPPKTKNSTGGRKVKVGSQTRNQSLNIRPTSSAIRSLLASKVAQRQQKKLELEKGTLAEGKVNGVEIGAEAEDSSASSSFNSAEDPEANRLASTTPPITSFQGILRNGLTPDECSRDSETVADESIDGKNKLKGMLIDLLERKVTTKESPNGLGNREIRISDRGLEIVDKIEDSNNSSSSMGSGSVVVVKSGGAGGGSSTTTSSSTLTSALLDTTTDAQQSSQMTFYSASAEPQVTLFEKVTTTAAATATTTTTASSNKKDLIDNGGGGGGGNNCDGESNNLVTEGKLGDGGGGDVGSDYNSVESESPADGKEALLSSTAAASSLVASFSSASGGLDGADLLEKFNEISDLIVVPPEQLGIKRPRTLSQCDDNSASSTEPPVKKANVNGSECSSATGLEDSVPNPIIAAAAENSGDVVAPATTTAVVVGTASSVGSGSTIGNVEGSMVATTVALTTSAGAGVTVPVSAPNQMMQLRLSVNPSNQLTFSRQLVLPSGQQLILSTQSKNSLQGQVIISKPHVTSNEQMAKAIIILQPSQQQQQQAIQVSQQPSTLTTQTTPSTQTPQLPQGAVQTLLQHQLQQPPVLSQQYSTSQSQQQQTLGQPVTSQAQSGTTTLQIPSGQFSGQAGLQLANATSNSNSQMVTAQIQVPVNSQQKGIAVLPSTVPQGQQQQAIQIRTVTPPNSGTISIVQGYSPGQQQGVVSTNGVPRVPCGNPDADLPYLCEWAGCNQRFDKPGKVFLHVSKIHTPEALTEAVRCEWGPNGCDPLLRKRLSLMTHLQDKHCTRHALEVSLVRRRNKLEPPPPPQHPAHHHLGYAPNAAFHAIKRHAMQFTNPKELLDDNEGPVTKSIRLTAALILKNVVQCSSVGRRVLRGYEGQLATIAMSNVESSRTVAQLLYDMKELPS